MDSSIVNDQSLREVDGPQRGIDCPDTFKTLESDLVNGEAASLVDSRDDVQGFQLNMS